MKTYTYKCGRSETRWIGKGVHIYYDGVCALVIHIEPFYTATLAIPGDTVEIKRLGDGTISAVVQENKKSRSGMAVPKATRKIKATPSLRDSKGKSKHGKKRTAFS